MKSKKLTNNLVMLAMLILPFSVLADVMPPPSMTTKDEGILFYEGIRIFERFLETASSPRFGLRRKGCETEIDNGEFYVSCLATVATG